jgi:hypothetical protein
MVNNIWTFICKKISKTWPLLVMVSLKYCVENRLLKTHVAFFMKVSVNVAKGTKIIDKTLTRYTTRFPKWGAKPTALKICVEIFRQT